MRPLKEALLAQARDKNKAIGGLKQYLDDPVSVIKNDIDSYFGLTFNSTDGKEDIDKILEYDKKKRTLIFDIAEFGYGDAKTFDPSKFLPLSIDKILFTNGGQNDMRLYPIPGGSFPNKLDLSIKAPKSWVHIIINDDMYKTNHNGYQSMVFEGPKLFEKCTIRTRSGAELDRNNNSNSFLGWVQDLYIHKHVYFGGGVYTSPYSWEIFGGSPKKNIASIQDLLTGIEKFRETGKKYFISRPNDANKLENWLLPNVPYNIAGGLIIIKLQDYTNTGTTEYYGEEFWWNEVFSKVKRWKKYETYCNDEFMIIY